MKTAAQVGLALLLGANAVMIFAHGLFGAGSLFSAVYLMGVTGLLLTLGRWSSLTLADYLAIALLAVSVLSVAMHPPTGSKEVVLLMLSFAAYPAGRGMADAMLSRTFLTVLAAMIVAGALVTFLAFGTEATEAHGKPMIFGQFDAAPIQFTTLLAFALFALAISRVRIALITVAVAVPIMIFAAAEVRLTFLALIGALLIGSAVAESRRLVTIAGVVVAFVLVGMICRMDMTMQYIKYAADSLGVPALSATIDTAIDPLPPTPAPRCEQVNTRNSIDIRKQLYKEAFALLPEAGVTGIGLGRFADQSCVNAEVHNSILQSAIELGIPAGLLFAALILAVCRSLWSPAKKSPDALLALCALSFAVLLSLGHGMLTDSGLLFLVLGYGAGTSFRSASAADPSQRHQCHRTIRG
jgi:hypothetical protein